VAVGVSQRIHAAAIFLLVKLFALADFDHARRSAAFAPVVGPVDKLGVARRGALAAAIDLVHVFPARYAQRTDDRVEPVFVCIQSRALEPHVKAGGAARAALRLVFQPLDSLEPVVHVVVGVDEFDMVLPGEPDVFVFANFVFVYRVDIRVVKINGIIDARCGHGLHDLARTGRAARMQKYLFAAVGQDKRRALDIGCRRGAFGVWRSGGALGIGHGRQARAAPERCTATQ
jgi:hypothetical protein